MWVRVKKFASPSHIRFLNCTACMSVRVVTRFIGVNMKRWPLYTHKLLRESPRVYCSCKQREESHMNRQDCWNLSLMYVTRVYLINESEAGQLKVKCNIEKEDEKNEEWWISLEEKERKKRIHLLASELNSLSLGSCPACMDVQSTVHEWEREWERECVFMSKVIDACSLLL